MFLTKEISKTINILEIKLTSLNKTSLFDCAIFNIINGFNIAIRLRVVGKLHIYIYYNYICQNYSLLYCLLSVRTRVEFPRHYHNDPSKIKSKLRR